MVKIAALAAFAGALTGLLAIGAWFYGLTPLHDSWVTLTQTTAALLIVDSFVAFLGPKRIFYSLAILSALLAGSEWFGTGSGSMPVLLTVSAAGVTLVLAMVAARFESGVSEQANPMNLPVFG
jgi:hypothetical protein